MSLHVYIKLLAEKKYLFKLYFNSRSFNKHQSWLRETLHFCLDDRHCVE